jgi:hypothetical protein
MKIMPNSDQLIGKSYERFQCLEHYGFDWRSFYNGWLEGRIDIIHSFNDGTCDFVADDKHYDDVSKKISDKYAKKPVYGWTRIHRSGERFPKYVKVRRFLR